jgi:predicted porin
MAQMGTQTFAATTASTNAGTAAITAPLTYDPVYTNGAVVGTTAAAGVLSTTEWRNKTTLLGVTHVTGPWTLKASYATAKRTGGQGTFTPNVAGTALAAVANIEDGASQKQTAVGAVYDLSKRTAVYGTYSKLTAKGQNAVASMGLNSAAAVGVGGSVSTTGIDLGLRHRF